jgi:DDE superfamily endonuclease
MVFLTPAEELELAAGAIRASSGRLLPPPGLFPTTSFETTPATFSLLTTDSLPLEVAAMATGVVAASGMAISAEAALLVLLMMHQAEDDDNNNTAAATPPPIPRSIAVARTRSSIDFIFDQLGPVYARRAYRMSPQTFYRLHDLLFHAVAFPPPTSTKKHRNGAKNGLIPSSIRLGVALRYFAGGSTYDLAVMHGISPNEVYKSVWMVLRAVNSCGHLQISFPADHAVQRQLADGFRDRSAAGFGCCVGAIDGMLVWIERPSKKDCLEAQCGSTKFLCGRKKKFGLNLQGTVDYKCRFLDVEISHPGSTSDFLAFATSDLKTLLECPGFLAPGLVLFGDNAYTNSAYMVTPFKGSRGESHDAYNFYHSQLRIQVECAFGRLVHRWGILRRPISMQVGIRKTCNLVMALCRLHNYCIDNDNTPSNTAGEEGDNPYLIPPLEQDQAYMAAFSAIDLQATDNNPLEPTGLLHGGEHFDDVNRNIRRRRQEPMGYGVLPQQTLHDSVVNQGLRRPTPRTWQ